jgi:hypothetical protein
LNILRLRRAPNVCARRLNAGVRRHMTRPNLVLTATAVAELRRLIGFVSYQPVVTIAWSLGGRVTHPDGRTEPRPPGWGVGFYNPEQIPEEEIVHISGIPFVFGQDVKSMELDGQLLDFDGRKFHVRPNAV